VRWLATPISLFSHQKIQSKSVKSDGEEKIVPPCCFEQRSISSVFLFYLIKSRQKLEEKTQPKPNLKIRIKGVAALPFSSSNPLSNNDCKLSFQLLLL